MLSRTLLSRQIRQPAAAPSLTSAFRLARHSSPITLTLAQQIRLLSDQTRKAIDKAVSSAPVVLFMKGTPETPQCGFSRASIQILGLQGVDPNKFAAFNVLEDPELRSGIKEYSDWPTIPQLYVDKEFVGGCDILVSMHQNGELAKLLEEKKVLAAAAEDGTKDPGTAGTGGSAGTGAPTEPSGTSEKENQGVAEKTSPKTSSQGNIGTDQNPTEGKPDSTPQGHTGTTGGSAKGQ